MRPTASSCGKADHRTEHRRPDRPEGARHGERERRAQGGRKTYHVCPTYNGGPRLAARRLQSEIQRHVYTAFESLHRLDGSHRSQRRLRSSSTTRPTSASSRPARTRRPYRRDLVETGKDVVELGDARIQLLASAGHRWRSSCSTAQWTIYLRALDADSGQPLWQTRLASQAVGAP